MATRKPTPPAIVISGDEPFQKSAALREAMDRLLPPEVDRAMALTMYDGRTSEDPGAELYGTVVEDLRTLPFLADRRVVVIRDADEFVSRFREQLEKYFANPSKSGVLVLECRSFPESTKLYKIIDKLGAELIACKRLKSAELVGFASEAARRLGKTMPSAVASRLVTLVGDHQGAVLAEVEKLSLYVGDRAAISDDDVTALVGQTREEKIFTAMDLAALGQARPALDLWHQVTESDPKAAFRAAGGVAYCLRRWIGAHRMLAQGMQVSEIAPKVMMWKRNDELATILRRLPARTLRRQLARLAELDAQVKVGARSIENGIEVLLLRLAYSG